MNETEKISIVNAFSGLKAAPDAIYYYESTDSTNERARNLTVPCSDAEIILDSRRRTSLFIANGQTKGRGRLERKFVSNEGAGLYMSIRFPFSGELADSVGITPFAAVAVCRAIEALSSAKPKIKWVNDVYLGEKKLAGILTESLINENGEREFICGIGVNLAHTDMPSEVAEIATNLADEGFSIDKYSLAAKISEIFLTGLDSLFCQKAVNEYKSRSCLIGRKVTVLKSDTHYLATVKRITDRYELEVINESGISEFLSTGEVSLKISRG